MRWILVLFLATFSLALHSDEEPPTETTIESADTDEDGNKTKAPAQAYDYSLANDAAYSKLSKSLEQIEVNLGNKVQVENKEVSNGPLPRVEVIVDSSGSMGQLLTMDKSKMYYMKKILTRYFLDQYQVRAQTGLRVYGSRRKGDCEDNELLVKFDERSLDKIAMNVATLAPIGRTPLFKAVQAASEDLASYNGPKAMVVFTDGEDTCGGTPCKEGKLATKDPKLNVQIFLVAIGFKPGSDDLKKVSCLGQTSTANSQDDLFENLGQINQKIFSKFINLVVKSPDPTAPVQVLHKVAGQWKPLTVFTAAFGTILPPGEYQAIVELNPPYRFGTFRIPPKKRVTLTVAGPGKFNVQFVENIMDVEVYDKNMKLVKAFKSDNPELVPEGRWKIKIHKQPFFEKFIPQYDVAPGGLYNYKLVGAGALKIVSKDIVGFYVYSNKNNLLGNYLTNFPFALPVGSYKIHVSSKCTFENVEVKDNGKVNILECKS